jgi:hypothetical protein
MCDTPLITEYIQTFCIDNQWPFGYIFIFLGIFLFGVIIKLIKQAKIKIKKITTLGEFEPADQTYCVLSLYVVKTINVLLHFCLLHVGYLVFRFLLFDKYQAVFITPD